MEWDCTQAGNNFMKRVNFAIFLFMFIVTPALAPAAAQDAQPAPNRLLQMLALTPDDANSRAYLGYVDYRALEAARGIQTLAAADFAQKTDRFALWLAAMGGVSTGMELSYLFQYLDRMQDAVGFSFSDIDQSLVFGQPPQTGTILAGNFDADRIAAAYRARDFQQTEIGGLPAWCGPDGCDSGLAQNLRDRNPANPFGGQFGRAEPLIVLPGFVADSPSPGVIESIAAAYQDKQPSLADAPEYRAIAEAVAQAGTLSQVLFINPLDLNTPDPALLTDASNSSALEIIKGYRTLPLYSLAAFADRIDGQNQLASVALVYNDEESANQAGEELLKRFSSYVSHQRRHRQGGADLYAGRAAAL
jgi:hypothetical protein